MTNENVHFFLLDGYEFSSPFCHDFQDLFQFSVPYKYWVMYKYRHRCVISLWSIHCSRAVGDTPPSPICTFHTSCELFISILYNSDGANSFTGPIHLFSLSSADLLSLYNEVSDERHLVKCTLLHLTFHAYCMQAATRSA